MTSHQNNFSLNSNLENDKTSWFHARKSSNKNGLDLNSENDCAQLNLIDDLSSNSQIVIKTQQHISESEKTSSCNTSDCSFEMGSDDDNHYPQLRSIDELFSAPPTVMESDSEEEADDLSSDQETIDKLVDFQPVKISTTATYLQPKENVDEIMNNNLCWSCQKEKPKYKCPRCSRKTCSLPCVKYHKQKVDCDGKRNKTEYVGKQDFSETHFLSDYRFLEEVNRCVSKRNYFPRPYFKNKSMKILSNKAYSMNIRLKLLPTSFKRRKENSTFYCFKNRQFLWHVEWIFDCCDVTISDRRLSDSTSLNKSVEKFILATTNNDQYDRRLHMYDSREVCFYMRKEGTPANQIRFYKLDGDKSLRSNLAKKMIVEYPRIIVIPVNQAHRYDELLCQD